jgi:hypothetical protein
VTDPLDPGAVDIGDYLVSSRSFDEYRAMSGLQVTRGRVPGYEFQRGARQLLELTR